MEFLKKGDKIHLVSPAGQISREKVLLAEKVLIDWGLQPVVHAQVFESEGYFAGPDEQRFKALQTALDDPDARAIFAVRGGFGTTRILDLVNFEKFKKSPKWVVGFSDITSLLLKLQNCGFSSLHATMAGQFGNTDYTVSVEALKKLLFGFGSKIKWKPSDSNRTGSITSAITGGNLSMISDSLGTSSEIQTSGRILFLEEINEDIYRLDRMLTQLRRAGKFDGIHGLVVGHLTGIKKTNPPYSKSVHELILECVNTDIPVSFGAPCGHEPDNYPLVVGGDYEFVVEGKESSLDLVI